MRPALLVDPGSRTVVVRLGPLSREEADTYPFADAAPVVTSTLREQQGPLSLRLMAFASTVGAFAFLAS